MGRTIEERLGIKRCNKKEKKKEENRRIRKLEKQVKEARQIVCIDVKRDEKKEN